MLSSHLQFENSNFCNWKVVPLQLLAFGHFHLVALNHVRAGISGYLSSATLSIQRIAYMVEMMV